MNDLWNNAKDLAQGTVLCVLWCKPLTADSALTETILRRYQQEKY